MGNIFLKPAPLAGGGVVRVRDPQTGVPLAASGEWKARSQYWIRRLRDGDVIEALAPSVQPVAFARCATCPEPKACEKAGLCALNHAPPL
ncbi:MULTISPECIES: DUF2635 domain-containing protein [unclassified Bradyrhizobium]|uniref:DUF2635 domain-containing protein n=1 Tax=unclassified Bradyrhizobium TaxID=2631580 RepID=UPI0039657B8D